MPKTNIACQWSRLTFLAQFVHEQWFSTGVPPNNWFSCHLIIFLMKLINNNHQGSLTVVVYPFWGAAKYYFYSNAMNQKRLKTMKHRMTWKNKWMKWIIFVEFIYISFHLCYTWAENSLENTFFFTKMILWTENCLKEEGVFPTTGKKSKQNCDRCEEKVSFFL